ncbi:FAD-dependent monooxygenase [Ancylobacter sonchi]|uniref:ketopantoate reductase family protein n=1 Tax=Ancylobacter sonchi TaxID=1937790 RepID=UPI001BD4B68F|nr:2-dehydropantoate 2-reductase N-terminal domain-containing protein [Ancylobacter sonchi]MBS7532500.1 FAD-dependent monooxygenase [Ancylobacter sonchi]
MTTKIAVLGSGANGSCLAADLANAGLDVVLIDQWPAHVEAIRANGLHVTMRQGEIRARLPAHHLCDLASMRTRFDVVFLVTKIYDTRWHAELIKPYLNEDGFLIGAQNGMTAQMIADIVGPSRTLGCAVELSSACFVPGEIKRNTAPDRTWFGLGSFHPATVGREAVVADVLRHAGKVEMVEDILSAKYMKLVLNSMTLGTMAMTGGELTDAQPAGMNELMMQLGSEALAVGDKLGHAIVPIFGLTRQDMEGSNNLLTKLIDKINHDIGPGRGPNTTLQDHMKGRLSEVDMINGLVVEQGERFGIATPANRAMVDVTHRIHAGLLKPDPSNLGVALELAGVVPAPV